jgi:hypothetical protein
MEKAIQESLQVSLELSPLDQLRLALRQAFEACLESDPEVFIEEYAHLDDFSNPRLPPPPPNTPSEYPRRRNEEPPDLDPDLDPLLSSQTTASESPPIQIQTCQALRQM